MPNGIVDVGVYDEVMRYIKFHGEDEFFSFLII